MRAIGPWFRLSFGVLLAMHVSLASAQSVDEARAAYEDARFEDAIAAVERAFDEASWTRRDLARALELRALAAFALGDGAVLDASLRQLAALEPNRVLAPETPPDLRARWETLRTEVAAFDARVELRREGDEVVAVAIANDLEGLARGYRVALQGPTRRAEAEGLRARLETVEGGRYVVTVAALGPGGLVLAEHRHEGDVTGGQVLAPAPPPNRRVRRALVTVSVVAVAVVALGVGLSFGLREDSDGVVLVGPQP